MVDTPRTVAEVLAMFPDAPPGNISAQDLRDFVVSVASPIPGGGFGSAAFDPDTSFAAVRRLNAPSFTSGMWRYNGGAFTAQTDITTAFDYYLFDWLPTAQGYNALSSGVEEWVNPDPVVDPDYWGGTLPAGTTWVLPAGFYAWQLFVTLEDEAPADAIYEGFVDYAFNPADYPVVSGIPKASVSTTVPLDVTAYPDTSYSAGWFMLPDELPVAPYLYTVNAEAITGEGVSHVWVRIWKVR